MGGQSTSQQQQTQNSTTAPWQPAQDLLTSLLGGLQNNAGNAGAINPAQSGALNTMENNANFYSDVFTPAVSNITNSFLNGGGANNQAGNVQSGYNQYSANTSPLANNTNYDPMQTPGIGDQLQALKDNITTGVNGQFAAAGRDGSAYNQKALASGLTAGLAPILTNQYNQNVQNQQTAAGNLYNAGNTNAGILSGLQQQGLANQAQGVGMIPGVTDTANSGANATLQAELQRMGIPLQQLGLLSQIGVPIAGLGSQSTGTGTSNTTNQMSGAQQFAMIGQGLGGFGKFAFG